MIQSSPTAIAHSVNNAVVGGYVYYTGVMIEILSSSGIKKILCLMDLNFSSSFIIHLYPVHCF